MFRYIRTPPYITCWILLLLNLHCMWPCRNLSLLFMHCIVFGSTLQNPTFAVFTFMLPVYVAKSFCCFLTFLWCTSTIFLCWFWIEMAKPKWHALEYTFLTSKPVSGMKMGDNRLYQSFSSYEGGSGQKMTTSDMRRDGQKRDILSDTLF